MSDSATVVIRSLKPTDKAFVVTNWVKSQYWGSPHWSQTNKVAFDKFYTEHVNTILAHSKVDLAVLSDSPDTILGFMVYSGPTIHWCYTKKDYRSQGILNLLLKNKQFTNTTSTTLPGAAISRKKKLEFNPFTKV